MRIWLLLRVGVMLVIAAACGPKPNLQPRLNRSTF
jgi:hypothetical protein